MEVEYSLTLADVKAFTFHQAKHSAGPSWKNTSHVGKWIIGAFMLTWIVSALFAEDPQIQPVLHAVSLLLIGACTGVVLSALDILRVTRRSTENYFADLRNRFLFGPRCLSIAAEGITSISEGFRDYLPWKAITDVVVTANHVFFFNGSLNAQVVPKHAFRDEQHFEEFVALARQYQQSGGPKAPKPAGIIAVLPPKSDATTRPDAL